MKKPLVRKLRCAVYTRKSSEEGLDMEFNSLDAQREACESYVASQRAEGWTLVPEYYDDGGFSGGTLERPALQRLIADIEAGKIDIVVVYKIDRLSRSLMDFAKLVEVFDRKGVTFVSVTQSFNTTTSMGRLTLNILLSFAQFEREVIGERIRDKFAASRKKGMWMGGWAPLGYDIRDRKLVVNETEAAAVRRIFERFAKCRSALTVVRELAAEGFVNKYGQKLDKGRIYKLLHNRVYVGDAVHKGTAYPGEHEAIIAKTLWDKVQASLAESPKVRAGRTRAQTPALLKGLVFGPDGRAMSPTHTRRGNKLYRYYVSQSVIKGSADDSAVGRLPAAEIEAAVLDQIRLLLRSPEIVVATWRAGREDINDLTESDVREALERLDPLWEELFPAEQTRIVQLLIDRVDVDNDGIDLRLRIDGLSEIARALASPEGGMTRQSASDRGTLTVRLPLDLTKRGGRKLVLAPGGATWMRPRVDRAVATAISRAFRWRKLLEMGAFSTIEEIATAEKINPSYVSRVLRLTLLAPPIVDAILDGRQVPPMRLDLLMKPFPVEWADQARVFGDAT